MYYGEAVEVYFPDDDPLRVNFHVVYDEPAQVWNKKTRKWEEVQDKEDLHRHDLYKILLEPGIEEVPMQYSKGTKRPKSPWSSMISKDPLAAKKK